MLTRFEYKVHKVLKFLLHDGGTAACFLFFRVFTYFCFSPLPHSSVSLRSAMAEADHFSLSLNIIYPIS